MTIIQNKNFKSENNLSFFAPVLIVAFVLVSVSGIFVYNKIVSINHEIDGVKNDLRDAEIKNVELKNKVSEMLNQNKLQSLITSKALVVDKNPEYVKINSVAVGQNREIGLAR